jgi:hypothetical protein
MVENSQKAKNTEGVSKAIQLKKEEKPSQDKALTLRLAAKGSTQSQRRQRVCVNTTLEPLSFQTILL